MTVQNIELLIDNIEQCIKVLDKEDIEWIKNGGQNDIELHEALSLVINYLGDYKKLLKNKIKFAEVDIER